MKQRAIQDFHGEGVVIGCTHRASYCSHNTHKDHHHFYTIDINKAAKPDFVFNLRGMLPQDLEKRFKLTYVENLPYDAYNQNTFSAKKENSLSGLQGFENIWNMTQDDGFILIRGCSRDKNYRRSLMQKGLFYIELNDNNNNILIPKNQFLSLAEIDEALKTLDPALQQPINALRTKTKLEFCLYSYWDMPSELGEHQKKITDNEKIHTAIERYLETRDDHLGFFAKCFDYARGRNRALSYKALFSKTLTAHQSHLVLYSLLAYGDSTWLKQCVYQALGFNNLKEAQEAVSMMLQLSEENRADLNKQIQSIGSMINEGIVSETLFAELKPKDATKIFT